jgi:HAD superfamily hydrolase (TIGR01549 family)
MTLKVISFDLDHTLWDPLPALRAGDAAQWDCLGRLSPDVLVYRDPSRLGVERHALLQQQPELQHNVTLLRQVLIARLCRQVGVSDRQAVSIAKRAFEAFMVHRHDVVIDSAAQPLLRQLAQRYTLVALTNGNADVYRTPLGPFFQHAWRAEDVGSSKPEPGMFLKALETTGIAADAMVHIGDSLKDDVGGAQGAGVKSIWLTQEANASHSGADAVAAGLAEIPAAIAKIEQND